MRIALLGATSHIARDLVLSCHQHSAHELVLYARRPDAVAQWQAAQGLAGRYPVADFAAFTVAEPFDGIVNCVGVGDPAKALAMGAAILDITHQYDTLALDYVRQHPACRYIFLSSGAAYGADFTQPVTEHSPAIIPINHLQSQDWYSIAKLYAECRHRAEADWPIIDIRVFSYMSRTLDSNARFLLADMLRAIRTKTILQTSAGEMVRDYLTPSDFYRLIDACLSAPPANAVVDSYSRAPISKSALLDLMQHNFGLQYARVEHHAALNATGLKPHYYSLNRQAACYGYQPQLSSAEGIVQESDALLRQASTIMS